MVRVGKKIDYFPLLSTNCVCVCIHICRKNGCLVKLKSTKSSLGPEMVQWVQAVAITPDNLSLISETYMMERENQVLQVIL